MKRSKVDEKNLVSDDDERRELLSNLLIELRNSSASWVSSKEISVWSAAVLYLAGVTATSGFIFDKAVSFLTAALFSVVVLLLVGCFIVFIHSQFSSLYFTLGFQSAVTILAFKLIADREALSLEDFTIERGGALPNIISEYAEKERLRSCRSDKHKHFWRILKLLWTLKRADMSPHEQQEATIYSMLLIATFVFLAIVLSRVNNMGFVSQLLCSL